MTLTLLKNASLADVKYELARMLSEGIMSSNVRQLTEQVTTGKEDKIAAVFDFIRTTFPYSSDPYGKELFIHPNRVTLDYYSDRIRQMDCDDFALLSGAMLGSIGYVVRIALLDTNFDLEIDHAIAQVNTELGWLNIDASNERPLGWYIESMVTEYVNTI